MKIDGVYASRLQLCREYLDAEMKSRDLCWKISRKEKHLARIAAISDPSKSNVRCLSYLKVFQTGG